jgi:hypothetical protein
LTSTTTTTSRSLISRRCREEEEKTRNLDIDNDYDFSLTHQPALPGGGGEDKESRHRHRQRLRLLAHSSAGAAGRRRRRQGISTSTTTTTSRSLISRRCREEEEKTRNLDIDIDNDYDFSLTHQPALSGGGGEEDEEKEAQLNSTRLNSTVDIGAVAQPSFIRTRDGGQRYTDTPKLEYLYQLCFLAGFGKPPDSACKQPGSIMQICACFYFANCMYSLVVLTTEGTFLAWLILTAKIILLRKSIRVSCNYLLITLTGETKLILLPDAYFAGCKHFHLNFCCPEGDILMENNSNKTNQASCKDLLIVLNIETEVLILHIAYFSNCRHFDNGRKVLILHIAYFSNCRHFDNGKKVLILHIAYFSNCRHFDNGRKVLILHIAYFFNCRHFDNGKKLSIDALIEKRQRASLISLKFQTKLHLMDVSPFNNKTFTASLKPRLASLEWFDTAADVSKPRIPRLEQRLVHLKDDTRPV